MHTVGAAENDPTGVRFDADIKRRLKEIAKTERRTFGAQVNIALEEWLRQRTGDPAPAPAPDDSRGGAPPSRRPPAPVGSRR